MPSPTPRWTARTPGMPARFERLRFMSADPGAAGTPGAPAAPADPAAPPAAPAAPAPAATPPAASADWDGKVESLPKGVQDLIADLRKENGAARTNAKAQAADEARQALVNELGKALGLIKDDGAAPKPEELAAQLQQTQAQAQEAAVELAVYRTAAQHGGNPAALTDSRAFLAKVATLDPTAEDFITKVTEAAKAAVTENPSLRVAPVAGASSVDHAGGSGERRTQPASLEAAAAAAYQPR